MPAPGAKLRTWTAHAGSSASRQKTVTPVAASSLATSATSPRSGRSVRAVARPSSATTSQGTPVDTTSNGSGARAVGGQPSMRAQRARSIRAGRQAGDGIAIEKERPLASGVTVTSTRPAPLS